MKPEETWPADIDAERAALGALWLTPDLASFVEIRAIIQPADFFQPDHGIICDCLYTLRDANKPLDPVTMQAELVRRDMLTQIGGKEYLWDVLTNSNFTHANGKHYAAIVREKAQRRELIRLADSIRSKAFGPVMSEMATDVAEYTIKGAANVIERGTGSGGESIFELAARFYEQMDQDIRPRLSLGFTAFDEAGVDIGVGETMIVGARPSMGKSLWAKQVAAQVSQRVPVVFVSVEESKEKITQNLMSFFAGITNSKLHNAKKNLSGEEWKSAFGTLTQFNKCKLTIIDEALTLRQIKAEVACAVAKHKAKLVIVDHMHRIQCWGKTPYDRASAISLELSTLFKELKVAGIVLAQLSRKGQDEGRRRPTMTDLRESGQIEQDADQIILLHREDYYRVTEPDYIPTQVAEFIIAKFRDGERGRTIRLKSYLSKMRFDELDQQTLILEQLP